MRTSINEQMLAKLAEGSMNMEDIPQEGQPRLTPWDPECSRCTSGYGGVVCPYHEPRQNQTKDIDAGTEDCLDCGYPCDRGANCPKWRQTEAMKPHRTEASPVLPPLPMHCDVAQGDHGGCNWSVSGCTYCACECAGCEAWWRQNPRRNEAPPPLDLAARARDLMTLLATRHGHTLSDYDTNVILASLTDAYRAGQCRPDTLFSAELLARIFAGFTRFDFEPGVPEATPSTWADVERVWSEQCSEEVRNGYLEEARIFLALFKQREK